MRSIMSFAAVVVAALLGASPVAAEPIPAPATLAGRQFNTLTYEGCYSSSSGLSFNSSYIFNSKGYCQKECVLAGFSVQATTNKTDCWCGNDLPPTSSRVDDSFCNAGCGGIDTEMCGSVGGKYLSVYLTGSGVVANPAAESSSSPLPETSTATPTTSAQPSVITLSGTTIVVTASSSSTASSKSSGDGTSKAGIAAGVVVGVVAITAMAGGAYLFIRNKRRREVEEEYKRNAAASQLSAGSKPPLYSGSISSLTDTRLDPVKAQRRLTDGSIADNEDYSRRILKVTNA